ncbi:MAG: hypothetical protein ACYDDU_04890 [Dermatophilaceae bacterium]
MDGLTGIAQLADASADVVVLDAYADGRAPAELTTADSAQSPPPPPVKGWRVR